MQLFSIGLWKLNPDGSEKTQAGTGERISSYTNDDVVTFARVWTGFDFEPARGNMEADDGIYTYNHEVGSKIE